MGVKKRQFSSFDDAMDSINLSSAHKMIILLVAIGTLFDGIEQYIAGYAAPSLVEQWGITGAQVGLLTTFTFGGMTLGSLIAGISGDLWGRKVTFMYNLGLYTVGALIAAFAPNIGVLYFARFIAGLGLGGELNTGLTIVSESVPTKYRGSSTGIVNIGAGGLGIVLAAGLAALIIGPFSEFLGGDAVAWRWLFGILALPALLLWVYRFFLPESPRYLVSEGRIDEANEVLTMLKTGTLLKKKLKVEQILDGNVTLKKREKVNFMEIFEGDLAKRTIGIWLIGWMAFGVQVGITTFLPTILASQGHAIVNSLVYSTVINVGGLIGAIIAVIFAHKVGRKKVLGWGGIIAFVISIIFGMSSTVTMILIFGAIMQFMFIVLNTTTWLYAPELYPTRIRSFGTGATVVVSLLSATIMPYFFGKIFSAWGTVGLFSFVGVMFILLSIATITFMVETQGKSLEEIANQ